MNKLRHYNIGRAFALITAICLLIGFMSGVAAVSWNTIDTDIDTFSATDWAYQRNMVKMDNGTLVAFYVDDLDINVMMSTSFDGGVTWTDNVAVDTGDKKVDQICVEIWPDVWEELDIIIMTWREQKTVDPDLYQIFYGVIDPYEWQVDWSLVGYVSTTIYNQTDPYISGNNSLGVVIVYAEETALGSGNYAIFETNGTLVGFGPDMGSIQWAEGEPAFSPGEVPADLESQRWPCLAMDRNETVHMSFSGLNTTGDPTSIWQYWYCNLTSTDLNYGDFMVIHNNSLDADQVKGSLICANVTSGAESRDGLVCAWEDGDYEGFTDISIETVGMWVGNEAFGENSTQLDTNGLGPSAGFHTNRILIVWQNLSTGDIYWGYADFTEFEIELSVTAAIVPGQTTFSTIRYDPALIWSYWGGHDKYLVIGTMAELTMSISDVDQVWCLNLYTAPVADPPPGGGGGSGGGGGGGGAAVEPTEDQTCCSSAAAMGIIITSSIAMVGWTRRKATANREMEKCQDPP